MTTATPDQVIELMTDFSPNRVHRWPASSAKAFEVYHLGETEADIRGGPGLPEAVGHMALRLVDSWVGDADHHRKRHAPAGRPHDVDRDTPRRGRHCGARRVAADLEEPERVDRGDHDAVHRSAVLVVVLQEGLRRPVIVELGG